MRTLRALLRLAALLALDAACLPVALATRLLDLAGARRAAVAAAAALQHLWGRATLAVCGIELEVRGRIPAGAHLVSSNHVSYVDIPVLAAVFPTRFVAKAEIAGWPFFGPLARSVGTLFVAPRRRAELLGAAAEIEHTLRAGTSVVLFPEGGSSRGARLERFHPALLEGPASAGLPCLPVVVHYAPLGADVGAAWSVAWWGGMDLWRHAWRLVGLPGVRARVTVGEPVRGAERKALAAELRRRMEASFEPLSQAPVPADLPWKHLLEAEAEARSAAALGARPPAR